MAIKSLNLVGRRFGALVVLSEAERRKYVRYWACRCDCGVTTEVDQGALRRGRTSSCGCKRARLISANRKTHGKTRTKLYSVWSAMRNRCINPRYPQFYLYGGRGIRVCSAWSRYPVFESWAIEAGYQEGLSIDRIDNDGDYSPANCRWVDSFEQGRNKRNNRFITHNGETKTLSEWARAHGLAVNVLHSRLKTGWSIKAALSTPARRRS